ncbi:hypothetical protein ACH47B_27020 [Rhodococcus sp. NPDC019627]|uniref:hypothetical protein n=1 Tax=unclassified Rhodococcus (in: high G+C Gram-positive bacteria) TaxID=192944 RepID=UPI0034037490
MNAKQKWMIGGAFALVVVLVAAAFAWFAGSDATESTPPVAAPRSPEPSAQGNNGATGFGDPTTDLAGRKVMIPNNPAGMILPQRDPGPRTECSTDQPTTSPGGVMIQRTFNVATLFSETDGPTTLDGNVISGYSRTPQGAALAGWNVIARSYVGGQVSVDSIRQMSVPSPELDALLDNPDREGADPKNLQSLQAPDAFRVLSCDPDFVSVEWGMKRTVDENGALPSPIWKGIRTNLLWRDGDWRAQFNRESISAGQTYSGLDGTWTRWSL